jgi:hypothetical protein
MRNKLRAFTILEMLINITIMSIIIGMVYYIYSSFSKQIIFYQDDIQEEYVLTSFCLRLKRDFYNAEKIKGSINSLELISYSNKIINYEVGGEFLYRRQQNDVDSLRISKLDVSMLANPMTKENLVQKAQITAFLFGENINFTVMKKYPGIFEIPTVYGD